MRLRNIPGSEEVLANSNYIVNNPKNCKGKWKEIFGNENPVQIEIGMGKGKFIVENAIKFPDINFIGIEKYSSVMLRAVQKLDNVEEIKNLRLICIDAKELAEVFDNQEVNKIFLNFSDPWPKDRHAKRRLTSKEFLNLYTNILVNNGVLEFKTDNKILFEFSVEEYKESKWILNSISDNLHQDEDMNKDNIMTEYEQKFSEKGNPIYKLIIRKRL